MSVCMYVSVLVGTFVTGNPSMYLFDAISHWSIALSQHHLITAINCRVATIVYNNHIIMYVVTIPFQ